ncbi:gamma-glutamylcyclotransferase [Paracoccus sp. Ld10]|uniref:gamma-glutamylcyclotransferase n=1 Tax=Paracoccus sp. Ld10 TaxID=649158 RepID=UPI00386DAECE
MPIFAYGSLIWNPGFAVQDRRRATAIGWHRDFCLTLNHFRGTPERPGLMLALASGGTCEELLLDIAQGTEVESLRAILRRELVALMSVEEQAGRLATAAGAAGSGADYLLRTARGLAEWGIDDDYIWTLQRLVAEQIEADPGFVPQKPRLAFPDIIGICGSIARAGDRHEGWRQNPQIDAFGAGRRYPGGVCCLDVLLWRRETGEPRYQPPAIWNGRHC